MTSNAQIHFQILYALLFFGPNLLRVKAMRHHASIKKTSFNNRLLELTGFICMLLFFGSALQFIFWPASMPHSLTLPLVDSMRYLGFMIGLLGAIMAALAEKQLGSHFSQGLELKEDHQLLQSGWYGRVRHPIYTAYIPLFIGYTLLAANAYTATVMVVMFIYCLMRIPLEEKMLIEHFGETYKSYQSRTGRILPKIYSST
jgi:protein-S-isoprenylcysteine O-methyltransferase Ste14